MGLPHGLKLIDKKLNEGIPASIRGVQARRKGPPASGAVIESACCIKFPNWF